MWFRQEQERNWRGLAILLAGTFLLLGCSRSSLPEGPKGKVQGKVTYKGTAVPVGSTVNFVHGETALPASGVIAADGTYTLRMRGGEEIPAGKYLISVIPPPTQTATAETDMAAYKAMMEGGAGAAKATTGPFPAKYQAAETSGLTFEVKEGPNTFDLDLKDGT